VDVLIYRLDLVRTTNLLIVIPMPCSLHQLATNMMQHSMEPLLSPKYSLAIIPSGLDPVVEHATS